MRRTDDRKIHKLWQERLENHATKSPWCDCVKWFVIVLFQGGRQVISVVTFSQSYFALWNSKPAMQSRTKQTNSSDFRINENIEENEWAPIKSEIMIGNKLQLPTNDFRLFPCSIYGQYNEHVYSNDVASEHATVTRWQKKFHCKGFVLTCKHLRLPHSLSVSVIEIR